MTKNPNGVNLYFRPKFSRLSTNFQRVFILIVALLSFLPFLGNVNLFDWDEINFAEAAREMIVSGSYSTVTIDFKPFWEKPPLFFWMQVLSMKLFGINEFAARFPNGIAGVLTLLSFFEVGNKLKGKPFGLIWSLLYLCSVLPHLYFKSGIIDPWFNLFIFWGVLSTYFYLNNRNGKWLFVSGLLIGLAILTKGPVALLIYGLTALVYFVIKKFKGFPSFSHILLFFVGLITFGGIWILTETLQGRFYIIQEFFEYQIRLLQTQDAGHGGPIYYHFLILLFGCFPLSAFALPVLVRKSNSQNELFGFVMKILFWVVLILFSLVKTKIVHYSSLCYFPLSFLAAIGAIEFTTSLKSKFYKVNIIALSTFWIIALFALAFIGNNLDFLIENFTIKDKFVVDAINYPTPFSSFDYLPSVLLLIGLLLFIIYKENIRKLTITLSFSYFAFMLCFALVVPKIERFSQGGATDFYQKHIGDVVYPLGFKSYAHLFYTQKPKFSDENLHDVSSALSNKFDFPVYFITKVQKAKNIELKHPELEKISSDRGFVFYVKKPSK